MRIEMTIAEYIDVSTEQMKEKAEGFSRGPVRELEHCGGGRAVPVRGVAAPAKAVGDRLRERLVVGEVRRTARQAQQHRPRNLRAVVDNEIE